MTQYKQISKISALIIIFVMLLSLCACAGTSNKDTLENENETQNVSPDGTDEYIDENAPVPDPLEGKEISDYTTLELAESIAQENSQQELEQYLLNKLYDDPVDTFDTVVYAAQDRDYFFSRLTQAVMQEDMPQLESALLKIYSFYDENRRSDVISSQASEQRTIVWSSTIDMRSEASEFGIAMKEFVQSYANSEVFGCAPHLMLNMPGTDYPVYITVDSETVNAAIEAIDGQPTDNITKTGIFIIPAQGQPQGEYELYIASDGTVAAVENETQLYSAPGQDACRQLLEQVQQKLDMTFTTVAGLTAADSITVMFMDEEMELIQDSDEISMMLEVIKSAVQVDVPEKEAFGPEIVISLSDGEKIDLRLIENEPTYVVTNYNICYDCGQNMFQLIDMAELLEEYGQ